MLVNFDECICFLIQVKCGPFQHRHSRQTPFSLFFQTVRPFCVIFPDHTFRQNHHISFGTKYFHYQSPPDWFATKIWALMWSVGVSELFFSDVFSSIFLVVGAEMKASLWRINEDINRLQEVFQLPIPSPASVQKYVFIFPSIIAEAEN
jgi:hypothetical protein